MTEDHSNKLTGWHFVSAARCPKCNATDTVKFHFEQLKMHCVDCNYLLDAAGIEELRTTAPAQAEELNIRLTPLADNDSD